MVYHSLSINSGTFLKTLLLINGKPCVKTTEIIEDWKTPNNFGIQSVNNYYKKCNLKERLLFAKIESDNTFKILKNIDESKAPGIYDLSGIFLNDSASLLAMPITQL